MRVGMPRIASRSTRFQAELNSLAHRQSGAESKKTARRISQCLVSRVTGQVKIGGRRAAAARLARRSCSKRQAPALAAPQLAVLHLRTNRIETCGKSTAIAGYQHRTAW